MLYLLASLTLLLTAADHWTTYLCLRSPIDGWMVSEANPLADWLFTEAGLVGGLAIDTVVTVMAVAFIVSTDRLPHAAKHACFVLIAFTTGYAVVNNLGALQSLGLSPLGIGVG
jgi:hypothetical protein